MARTTILPAGQTAATSTDIVVAAGETVTVGIFVPSGTIPPNVGLSVVQLTPGAANVVAQLTLANPAVVLSGAGAYGVVRTNNVTASVGAFTET